MNISRRHFLQATSLTLPLLALPGLVLGKERAEGSWRQLASLPYPVQEIYPALIDGNIHLAGGFALHAEAGLSATDRHIRYDIGTDSWQTLAPLPEVRHHANLVACRRALYALGGFKPDTSGDWVMQQQTWIYDIDGDSWREAAAAPERHGESVCLALGDVIHVIGGRSPRGDANGAWQDHADSDRHLTFDTASGQWQRAAPALHPRNSAAGAVIDGHIYVVGGRTVTTGNVGHLEVYDPREDKWRLAAPMPQAQGGLAAAAIGNQLIAFGGEYFGRDGHGVLPQAWRYDTVRDRWSALAPMPTPRHGLGAASDGKAVFAIGGATQAGANGTSAVLEAIYF